VAERDISFQYLTDGSSFNVANCILKCHSLFEIRAEKDSIIMEINRKDIDEVKKTDLKLQNAIDELKKASITGIKYDFNYYSRKSMYANRSRRGGFILKDSISSTNSTQKNLYPNEEYSPSFRDLQRKLSHIPRRRIIRYDRKIMVVVRKVMTMQQELIEKLYRSKKLFLNIDQRYIERAKNNAANNVRKQHKIK
jgi:uncharacterized NAD(P)/FAD-binding protein YdhS